MIFHATALSSYSAKVRIVLCVKQVPHEERAPVQGYRSPEYRAVVPMGTLPAIQEGDWVLSESEAINEYLEECFPEPALLPRDPRARAKVRFLSRFHDLHLEPLVRRLFAQVRAAERDQTLLRAQRALIEARLVQLSQMTRPSPWLAGSTITLADCGFLVTLPLAGQVLGVCGHDLTVPSALQGWLSQSSSHPAVERALAPWRAATASWLAGS
jgi:glutathione S-transferase